MEQLLTPRSAEHIDHLQDRLDRGRDAPVPETAWARDYRSPVQRDRDRILYSAAFQRLAYVTQVTAPELGHAFHNRLGHSLKVAQVGRRNAERLRAIAESENTITGTAKQMVLSLDPDAIEASCLAHDLGHPPFGHIAEKVLNEAAREHLGDDGGFEGNAQSFRIVTRMAQRASGSGLNLTRQTLDGLLKYPWRWWHEDLLDVREHKWGYYLTDQSAFDFARMYYPPETPRDLPERSLEALIMDWADDLTYAVHDVDDFFRAGLIPLHRLADDTDDEFKRLEDLMEETRAASPKSWPAYDVQDLLGAVHGVAGGVAPVGAYRHTRDLRRDMRRLGSELITRYLSAFEVTDDASSAQVRVSVDPDLVREVEALKLLVRLYVVSRPGLAVVQHGQQRVIRDLFRFYFEASDAGTGNRRLFPPGARETLEAGPNEAGPRARVVTDLIAGLTESAAIQLHHRMAGGWTAPALDATAQIG